MVISNVSSSENFTSDVRAQIKQILAKGISNPETIPSHFGNSKGDEYIFSQAALLLNSEGFAESLEEDKRLVAEMYAEMRAEVKKYREKNPTAVSALLREEQPLCSILKRRTTCSLLGTIS